MSEKTNLNEEINENEVSAAKEEPSAKEQKKSEKSDKKVLKNHRKAMNIGLCLAFPPILVLLAIRRLFK